ncbi:MAG: O-methyltransferase [Ginsengibacter sp.]
MDEIEIIHQKANEYASAHSTPTDDLLKEIEKFTLDNHAHSVMLSGPLQGKVLEMISLIKRPKTILEIGTFTGYSALCLAKGLTEDGEIHTIELRKEDAETAKAYFAKSLHANRLHLHIGNALDIIQELDFKWDIIFIDADKTNYINYYELTLPNLKDDGIMIIDNVLFHGQVLNSPIKGKNAKAIHSFNSHVAADDRVQQVVMTVRDGLMLIRKK